MNINDFLGIAIVGSFLSLVIHYIKEKLGTTSFGSKMITLGLAVAVGGFYWFLRDTSAWETILGVLAASSTVYAFFLKDSGLFKSE
jgi:hypothetical protein